MAIDKVLTAVRLMKAKSRLNHSEENSSSVPTSDAEDFDDDYDQNSVVLAVRQELAPALRALIEHGLYEV